MRIRDLLEAYDNGRTLSSFRDRLASALKADRYPKYRDMDPQDALSYIESSIPAQFVLPALRWYCTPGSGLSSIEDIGIAADALEYVRKFNIRGIDPARMSLTQVLGIAEQHRRSRADSAAAGGDSLAALSRSGDVSVLGEVPGWVLIKLLTKKGSMSVGRATRWCTAAKSNNQWSSYRNYNLYVFLKKPSQGDWLETNQKWQLGISKNWDIQLMDSSDARAELGSLPQGLVDLVPEMALLRDERVQLAAVKKDGSAIRFLKNPSEAVQIAAVKKNPYAIQYIENPSEAVQLAAVKNDGYAIRCIKNPSEAVQLAAVQQNGYTVNFIENPSEAVQLAAVQQNGYAIQFVKNPSEAVQLAAVQQNGFAIGFIKDPSESVQLAAVKQNGYAIQFVKNPSEAVQLTAVQQNGLAIQFVKNPSEAVQLAAVKKSGFAIRFIENPSEAVQLAAVQQNGLAIQYIEKPSKRVLKLIRNE
jgi:hypothetical protein